MGWEPIIQQPWITPGCPSKITILVEFLVPFYGRSLCFTSIAVLKGNTASVRPFQLNSLQVRNDAMYVASGQMVAAPSR